MPATSDTRSAVFLVRVWLEDGVLQRARIIEDLDLFRREETAVVVGTADEIEQRIQDWLERLSTPVTPP